MPRKNAMYVSGTMTQWFYDSSKKLLEMQIRIQKSDENFEGKCEHDLSLDYVMNWN